MTYLDFKKRFHVYQVADNKYIYYNDNIVLQEIRCTDKDTISLIDVGTGGVIKTFDKARGLQGDGKTMPSLKEILSPSFLSIQEDDSNFKYKCFMEMSKFMRTQYEPYTTQEVPTSWHEEYMQAFRKNFTVDTDKRINPAEDAILFIHMINQLCCCFLQYCLPPDTEEDVFPMYDIQHFDANMSVRRCPNNSFAVYLNKYAISISLETEDIFKLCSKEDILERSEHVSYGVYGLQSAFRRFLLNKPDNIVKLLNQFGCNVLDIVPYHPVWNVIYSLT